MFSKHFHERLMQRCSLALTLEEQLELAAQVRSVLSEEPPQPDEDAIQLNVVIRGEKFVAVYVVSKRLIVTAHKGRARRYKHRKPEGFQSHTKRELAGKRRRVGRTRGPLSGRPRIENED